MKNTEVSLKPFRLSYASAFYKILTDKEFLCYWSHQPPSSIENEKKIIKEFLADKTRKDFAIFYKGKIAGFIGVMPKKKDNIEYTEIGYGLDRKYWGKGITTESLRQVLLLLEKKSKKEKFPRHLIIVSNPKNKASQKIALKNGFKEIKNLQRKKIFCLSKISDFVSEKQLDIVLPKKTNSLLNPIS